MEIIDVVDEHLQKRGTATRAEVHEKGYWHQTFHCWVVFCEDSQACVVLQRRSAAKDTNPNKLDVSCAGHLMAGERVEDGVRELEEELGIEVPFKELTALGVHKHQFRNEKIQDNEFSHVFGLKSLRSLKEYEPQWEEISGLYQAKISELMLLFRGQSADVEIQGLKMEPDGHVEFETARVGVAEFVLRQDDYYLKVLDGLLNLANCR
ncbi:NUDIX domain-containing protein [Alicyclobacillus tolerans]|uniref:NUDIX hydrolase n=1 Tax=Alicyclobacillus tolerans TaxID=90970 RepID=UPI001F456EDD|nr:NUDIX domain-containing protein [Alicyclobacillus tolerans]MCF8566732.1 NUDIX domain-containing protein [Alicyclobacillus tolerans]